MTVTKKHLLIENSTPSSSDDFPEVHGGYLLPWKSWLNKMSFVERQLFYRRWLILVIFVLIFIIGLDVLEHHPYLGEQGPYFVLNVFVLLAVITLAAVAVQARLFKIINHHSQEIETLNHNHELSQQLAVSRDSEEIADIYLQHIHHILPVSAASLLIFNRETNGFQSGDDGKLVEGDASDPILSHTTDYCKSCALFQSDGLHPLERCKRVNPGMKFGKPGDYCLPIAYRDSPAALVRMSLMPNEELTSTQIGALTNSAPIIAATLEGDRRRRDQMNDQISKAKTLERRSIARDLHDNLSQDLCYINLKLEQVTEGFESTPTEQILKDLKAVRNIIGSDYESIRGTLASLYPNNSTGLGTLLHDHANLVAERSDIHFAFASQGRSRDLDPETIRQIFYICREALHNIEKHAQATRVDMEMDWGDDDLMIRIHDNGRGFDVDQVKPGAHFGLKIMRERVEALNGRITIASARSGTQVEFRIPYDDRPLSTSVEFVHSKPLLEFDRKQ